MRNITKKLENFNRFTKFSAAFKILILVPLTNQELANYSATARESLNRMLGELRRQNIIEMRDGLIFIKDIDFLKSEIPCENCGKEICNIE